MDYERWAIQIQDVGELQMAPPLYDPMQDIFHSSELTDFLLSACFSINNICNLNCVQCISDHRNYQNATLQKVKETLRILKAFGLCRLSISGGEPLLHKNILEIVALCNELSITPQIVTQWDNS